MAHREVLYHMSQPVVAASVWDPLLGTDGVLVPGGRAPVSYGGNAYNLGLASGQWSMAAADIVRLMTTLDTPGELLDAAHVQAITQETFAEAQTLGFAVAEATAGVPELGIVASPRVIYHTGSWVTTSTLAFRTDDGMAVALLLNTNFPNALRSPQILELLPLLQFAESLWPDEDLFPDALAQVE
jgi:hypothetical protein